MSSTQFASIDGRARFHVSTAWALPAILVLGFALRVGGFWTHIHVLRFDETMQYFEQGHRLAFGSGIVPWEFSDGIRSWLLPGIIAGVMRVTSWFSGDPMLYVRTVRVLCAALAMVVVAVGFRTGHRHAGMMGAIVTGGFCAIWFDLIYFAPAVMTEVLAAHCAIAALYAGDTTRSKRSIFWVGALLGLAVCLRYQYAPALGVAVLWQQRHDMRTLPWLVLGSAAVMLPLAGVLDLLTWGTAFQSIWLNFQRNSVDGVAAAIGTESAGYYLAYLMDALPFFPVFMALAIMGGRRFPALAIAAAATFVMHSLVPHKEVRFIYLTIAALPILIGLGAADMVRMLEARLGPRAAMYMAPGFLLFSALISIFAATSVLGGRWSFQRGTVRVFLAAHDAPGMCGLRVRGVPPWKSGGYTYLHRDVPLSFDPPMSEVRLPGLARPLRFYVERAGVPVPQSGGAWSHEIAMASDPPAGLNRVVCFPGDANADEPEFCLFERPAGCQ